MLFTEAVNRPDDCFFINLANYLPIYSVTICPYPFTKEKLKITLALARQVETSRFDNGVQHLDVFPDLPPSVPCLESHRSNATAQKLSSGLFTSHGRLPFPYI